MRSKFKASVILQAWALALSAGLVGAVLILIDPGSEASPAVRVTPSPMWHPPADWTGVP